MLKLQVLRGIVPKIQEFLLYRFFFTSVMKVVSFHNFGNLMKRCISSIEFENDENFYKVNFLKPYFSTRYVNGTPTSEVTPVTIWYIRPPHHGYTSQYHGHERMTHILFVPCQSAVQSWIKLIQTLTLKLQGQGHGCGQKARAYSRPSIILTNFLFISHQSDQQFLRYSYFEIWPWNIQGQGHEWGQRSRLHIISSLQPMHFLFVSHESDQPFLRYGQNSIWPW